MKLTRLEAECAALNLCIETDIDSVTEKEVTAAYRALLRAWHPDTAAELSPVAADNIVIFRAARDMLLEWIRWRPDPNCRICNGSGFKRTIAFGSQPCPRCSK